MPVRLDMGDLADQVATKWLSGSRAKPSISGLLRFGNQRGRGPSWWWGDWEAGGRTSEAGGGFLARLSLDALFQAPKDSSQKMSAPTGFSLIDAQAGSGFSPAETQAESGFLPADSSCSAFSHAETQAEALSQRGPEPKTAQRTIFAIRERRREHCWHLYLLA